MRWLLDFMQSLLKKISCASWTALNMPSCYPLTSGMKTKQRRIIKYCCYLIRFRWDNGHEKFVEMPEKLNAELHEAYQRNNGTGLIELTNYSVNFNRMVMIPHGKTDEINLSLRHRSGKFMQ